jgi:hypothetical protein
MSRPCDIRVVLKELPLPTDASNRPDRPARRHPRARSILLVGSALALLACVTACSSSKKSPATTTTTTSTTSTTLAGTTSTVTSVSAPSTVTAPASTAAPGGSGGGGNPGTGGAAPTSRPSSPAPVITSFNTPATVDCDASNSPFFSASWTTTGAVKTTISIDGPGIYKTYGPNASDSLPFNCSSSHTFLLTAYSASGVRATRSITLQPRDVSPTTPSTTSTTSLPA